MNNTILASFMIFSAFLLWVVSRGAGEVVVLHIALAGCYIVPLVITSEQAVVS
jgi:hypothetical protein